MYASLGPVIFEGLLGFTALSRETESSFAEHALIDSKPRLQRIGDGLTQLNFVMALHASFTDPAAAYTVLEASRANGDSLTLVLGNGQVIGNFVITTLAEDVLQTAPDGTIIHSELSVSLKEFVSSGTTQATGFAMSGMSSIPVRTVRTFPSNAASITSTVQAAAANARKIDTAVNDARKAGTMTQNGFNRVKRLAKQVQAGVVAVQKQVEEARKIYDKTRALQSAAIQTYNEAKSIEQFAEVEDLPSLFAANNSFMGSVGRMERSSGAVASIAGLRKDS